MVVVVVPFFMLLLPRAGFFLIVVDIIEYGDGPVVLVVDIVDRWLLWCDDCGGGLTGSTCSILFYNSGSFSLMMTLPSFNSSNRSKNSKRRIDYNDDFVYINGIPLLQYFHCNATHCMAERISLQKQERQQVMVVNQYRAYQIFCRNDRKVEPGVLLKYFAASQIWFVSQKSEPVTTDNIFCTPVCEI